jgi:glycerol-3-phosphate acyltransferase PlsY
VILLDILYEFGFLFLSYLFGSIPFSIVLGKLFHNIDVRLHGSKNPGTTNSMRYLGKTTGFLIAFFDILKGALFIFLIRYDVIHIEWIHPIAFGVVAAFGHVFSPFLKFHGGKAVATTAGMILAFNFVWAIIAFIAFVFTIRKTKYVSLASSLFPIIIIILAIITGLLSLIPGYEFLIHDLRGYDPTILRYYLSTLPYFLFIAGMIIYRHKENFDRIKRNEETKTTWFGA